MGRPKKEIDAQQVEKLAGYGCSWSEIGAFFDCSEDTLQRRFAAEYHKGGEHLKTRLRRAQLRAAFKGNIAMLIWLGKAYLNQADKAEITQHPVTFTEIVGRVHARREALKAEAEAVARISVDNVNGNGNGNARAG